jgi:hypothetical protein
MCWHLAWMFDILDAANRARGQANDRLGFSVILAIEENWCCINIDCF